MQYIRFKNSQENQIKKFISSTPGKALAGLVIFVLIIIFFIFGGTNNFFFERTGFESFRDRTNVLILGTGGEGHQGINLSDTIILASVDLKQKDVALISIPRDLWIDNIKAKINTVYAFGEKKEKGEGLKAAKEKVEEILGVPIHYGVRVDFSGFVRAIDTVGGIDIFVETGFEDFKYPIAGKEEDTCGLTLQEVEADGVKKFQVTTATGAANLSADPFACRYEHIQFKPGVQRLDGGTALKYVRSRMGTNGAGSDFARSLRQRQVTEAFVNKIFDLRNLFSPKKILEIFTTFGASVDTDFSEKEISQVPTVLSTIKEFNVRSLVPTSEGENPLLYNPPVIDYGAWVLLPQNNNWEILRREISNFIYQQPKTS